MRVDVHNHVIPRPLLDLVRAEAAFGVDVADGYWRGPDHVDFPLVDSFSVPAARLDDLERAGLEGAVVSPAPCLFPYRLDPERGERWCRVVNEGLAEFCATAPERLRFMADVPLQDVDLACQLTEEAAGLGAVAVAVGTSVAGARLDEAPYRPFLALLERLRLPLLVHPAFNDAHPALAPYYLQNVIGNPLETTIVAERLMASGALGAHPGLTVILVHGGGFLPYQLDRLRHASQVREEFAAPVATDELLSQLRFDTVLHGRAALAFLVERVGVDRVLLGTDMPFDMAVAAPFDALRAAVGDEAARVVAEENPTRLFCR
ncbi:MAG TPA: amidohydrolase family protein [Acidimicrobiales bacterium]|nr:amidohydrolase family protein [Acidimicrobiales bacterium]